MIESFTFGTYRLLAQKCAALKNRREALLSNPLVILGIILSLGCFLLTGRYNWALSERPYAVRGYATFLYIYVLFFPALYFLLLEFNWREKSSLYLTSAFALLFAIPYRWLGWDRHFFHLSHPVIEPWNSPHVPPPHMDWFPKAFSDLGTIPYGIEFFVGVLLTFYISIFLWRRRLHRETVSFLPYVIVTLLVVQTWGHLSMRSPYTYVPHYEGPKSSDYWYHYYLFANGKGAVNLDYHAFRPAEEMFIGVPRDLGILSSRVFPTFFASQLAAFINPYYAWLVLNILVWALASLCLFQLAKDLYGEQTAVFSVLLIACAQGIILYIAQPKPYAFAHCAVAITVFLFLRLFDPARFRERNAVVFGVWFGLMQLCYESQPWLIVFPVLARFLRMPVRWVVFSVLLALGILEGFQFICRMLPALTVVNSMTDIAGNPIQNILNLFKSGNVTKIAKVGLNCIRSVARVELHAFQLVVIPAVWAYWKYFSKRQRVFHFILILPAIITFSIFELGENWIYTRFPRLVYSSYVSVYIAAGFALARIAQSKFKLLGWKLGKSLAYGFILLLFCYTMADTFGYPVIYYSWFYRNTGFSLEP